MLHIFSRMFKRTKAGAVLAESAASMVIIIPLAVLILFVLAECSFLYMAKAVVSEAARHAARDLAIQYGVDPNITTSRANQEVLVFDGIRIGSIVTSSSQFDPAIFDTSSSLGSVTVVCRYPETPAGFPLPDPLHLRTMLTVTAESTYRLE